MTLAANPLTTPPCIFCGCRESDDVTPLHYVATDRLYQCHYCKRKFMVRIVPEKGDPPPA